MRYISKYMKETLMFVLKCIDYEMLSERKTEKKYLMQLIID